jgi:ATP-binding cassette subfamily B protein
MFVIISKAIASADRIVEVIDTPDDLLVSVCERLYDGAYIRFDNVTFSYNNVKPNLEDISFSLQKGETLGIIGATGSGKSTMAQLLMRYYDVNSGAIYIDGENIKSIPIGKLRKMFGVVFQNDTIFEDSISENVRLGRSITDDEIKRAVSSARAKEFVEEEGRGYDNHVNIRGANLSGGQKQRILIARALAGNPDILILDDSSSALDYRTDAALRGELSRNYATATKIIIAQRVSSIMQADLILVLDEGKIIGRGKHDELMESCEIYRQISSSQLASSK